MQSSVISAPRLFPAWHLYHRLVMNDEKDYRAGPYPGAGAHGHAQCIGGGRGGGPPYDDAGRSLLDRRPACHDQLGQRHPAPDHGGQEPRRPHILDARWLVLQEVRPLRERADQGEADQLRRRGQLVPLREGGGHRQQPGHPLHLGARRLLWPRPLRQVRQPGQRADTRDGRGGEPADHTRPQHGGQLRRRGEHHLRGLQVPVRGHQLQQAHRRQGGQGRHLHLQRRGVPLRVLQHRHRQVQHRVRQLRLEHRFMDRGRELGGRAPLAVPIIADQHQLQHRRDGLHP